MCILLTHSSENGRFGRSSNPKCRTFSRLLRGLRFVSKLDVLSQGSRILRIHILLKFEILFLEAYRFQNSEGLEGLKEYALTLLEDVNFANSRSPQKKTQLLCNYLYEPAQCQNNISQLQSLMLFAIKIE